MDTHLDAPDDPHSLTIAPARPSGVVTLSGAKNSALRLLVASLLTDDPIHLERFPGTLLDAHIQVGMLRRLGKAVDHRVDRVTITTVDEPPTRLEWSERSIRNTLLVLGAMLARRGEGRVPLPGGCAIGDRPFDLHEQLFRSLGAEVWVDGDDLCARHPRGRLDGGSFHSPVRSTGVTENALLCGALNPEGVELVNPHLTPEVQDLIGFLRAAGAEVEVNGSHSLAVRGPGTLSGVRWQVIPDRMEAITWAAMAVTGRGDVEIRHAPVADMSVALEFLRTAGARIFLGDDAVIVRSDGPQPFSLSVGSHPAVHSDMQPCFGAIAALATGRSEIVDLRYPDRFAYLDQLATLGADTELVEGRAVIHGTGRLEGGRVRAADLRAGASLVVAGVATTGPVEILDAWQVLRGYDRLADKLAALGVPAHFSSDETAAEPAG